MTKIVQNKCWSVPNCLVMRKRFFSRCLTVLRASACGTAAKAAAGSLDRERKIHNIMNTQRNKISIYENWERTFHFLGKILDIKINIGIYIRTLLSGTHFCRNCHSGKQ